MAALAITLLELTEVAVLVVAMGGDATGVRSAAQGAIAGTAVVAIIALASGAALERVPSSLLLGASGVVLFAFGLFLLRSTIRSYRAYAPGAPARSVPRTVHWASGFTVGAVETTEAAIVLVALAAGGYPDSALVGAVIGGVVLVVGALAVRERLRAVKVPLLKLAATSLLFAFAIFWTGEAAGVMWPFGDVALAGLFVLALVAVRGTVTLVLRSDRPTRFETNR